MTRNPAPSPAKSEVRDSSLSTRVRFGGYKHSGLGRESGQQAIHEYL